jgi:ABC-type transport system involved in multi-copper enzyme maturation permease subunit
MNALVKKEIRLVLPGWLAVLLLETVQPWFWNDPDFTFEMIAVIFFFGINILAVDSFGREFSLGTFSSLLAQPVERGRIWRTKITVLLFAAALIFAAYFTSCELRLHYALLDSRSFPNIVSAWTYNPTLDKSDFRNAMLGSGVAMLVALVGGLWTTLLLRQVAASFWITFLVPSLLLALMILSLPAKLFVNSHLLFPLLCGVAGIYIVAGFWLAHRLFRQAEDVAWTGGIISFSTWRYFESGSKSSVSTRRRKPFRALLNKEFQLQSITFFCATALLVLHIVVFFLRIFYANRHRDSILVVLSDCFWMLWLVMPLVIGGTAVAEERKLGVAESQFCLPVSRRALFAIKFIPAMIFGVLLGGVMPLLLETLAAHFGAPSEMFQPQNREGNIILSGDAMFSVCILTLAAGLTLAALFASTLARNFLQALSLTIVTIIGCCLLVPLISYMSWHAFVVQGIPVWPGTLMTIIAIPTLSVTFLWLVYRNFSYFHERGRLWRRNILGVIAALSFIIVSSAMIYNRAWEVFEPTEPAHGPAKLSLANPPRLYNEYGNLLVYLPDGRVWFDSLGLFSEGVPDKWKQFWLTLVQPLPKSAGPQEFLAGSNWASVSAMRLDWWYPISDGAVAATNTVHHFGYLDTAGVKSDGTLWISSQSKPEVWSGGDMIQFGGETNWQQVARSYAGRFGNFLLLKKDGTLWRWGTNHFSWDGVMTNWPTVRNSKPYQIGTNSDWKEIGRKTDGTAWAVGVDSKTGIDKIGRWTNMDQIPPQTVSRAYDLTAYVRQDGTLWFAKSKYDSKQNRWVETGFQQLHVGIGWTALAVSYQTMIALKSDGTLWQWDLMHQQENEVFHTAPTQLGIHNDWIGLVATGAGAVSLAADGSLWFWPDRTFYSYGRLIKLPKQPELLGNLFSKSD